MPWVLLGRWGHASHQCGGSSRWVQHCGYELRLWPGSIATTMAGVRSVTTCMWPGAAALICAAALAWCCRTGIVLPHWNGAAALEWCCRTGIVLPHRNGAAAPEWCCRTGMVLPHWNGAAALNGALALDGAVHARVVLQHWMVLPALELCYPHRSRAARTRVSCCPH